MKRIITTMIILLLCLAITVSSQAEAFTIGKDSLFTLEVPEDMTYGLPDLDDPRPLKEAYYIAYITNVSGKTIQVENITADIFDADGNLISFGRSDRYCGSWYLEAGETTVVSYRTEIDKNAEAVKAKLTLHLSEDGCPDEQIGANEISVKSRYDPSSQCLYSTVKNISIDRLKDFYVVSVLEDPDGNPIYFDTFSSGLMILEPGNAVTAYSKLSDSVSLCKMLKVYFTEHHIEPGTVNTFVSRAVYE